MAARREVVVVGGGQTGLAIGYFLAQQGRDFTILEAADEPAAAWRERWDSLKLFTSARYDALPGMGFPGDPERYPTRDEVAQYLTEYARHFDLPVELGSRVRTVRRADDGYLVEVGGGNTGYQIAEELSSSYEVHLSIGSRQTPLPQRILGQDLFWYLEAMGLIRKTTASRIGRRMSGRDTLIGSTPRGLHKRHNVELHGRAVSADGSIVRFADQTEIDVVGVVWATGFHADHSWVDLPIFDDGGRLVHQRGVTEAPGLYFL